MKVFLISSHFSKYVVTLCGGFPASVRYQVVLSKSNYSSEVSGLCSKDKLSRQPKWLSVSDFPSLRSPIRLARSLLRLTRRCWAFRPDVVHAQETLNDCSCIWLLLFCWKPFILTVHDVTPHPGSDGDLAMRARFYRFLIRRKAAAIIVHGRALEVSMRMELRSLSSARSRLVTIPHPALPPSRTRTGVRNEYRHPVIVFAGRMEAYKGLGILLSAVQRLHNQGIRFVLRIVGQGPSLDEHMHSIRSMEFVEVMQGYLNVPEFESHVRVADVVVAPYLEGSQSGILCYAVGFGKPIVATTVGSLSEVAIDGLNAVTCPPNNVDALANALARVIVSRKLREQLSLGSAQLATGALSASTVGAATSLLYREVVDQR